MSFFIRPLVAAVGLALAFSVQAAKPAKAAKAAAKPAATPVASADPELSHNLGQVGQERLQAVVDRFNTENGTTLKLVRHEKGQKPTALNLIRRYDMAEVLAHPDRKSVV